MYFHQGFKILDILKSEFFFLPVFGGIIVKMDNFHLFEKVLNFLFHE
jgi:hypothetical protein